MADGKIDQQLPIDDATIADDTELWRRIHPTHIVPDGRGGKRVSSAAFTNSKDGSFMSVVIGEEQVTAERVLCGNLNQGLFTFTAGFARSVGQRIIRKPIQEEPLHGEVCGKKTSSVKNSLSRGGRWIFIPLSCS